MQAKDIINHQKPFLGVIAEDASHSLSPFLHKELNKYMDTDIPYYAFDILKENFNSDLELILKSAKGINVTIPYKTDVIKYLHFLADDANAVNAVNTIDLSNEVFKGYNTDITGFWDTLMQNKVSLKGKKIIILGTGGVSVAIAYAAKKKGGIVTLVTRNIDRADSALKKDYCITDYNSVDYSSEILINGTPVGMERVKESCLVDLASFTKLEFVFDSVYNPFYTPLILSAKERKIKFDNGLYMLLAQGYHSRLIWGDKKISDDALQEVYQKLKIRMLAVQTKKKEKLITLCGFMGTGKSYLGKKLAVNLGYDFIDLDEVIESKHGKISEIFDNQGEVKFREMELECVKSVTRDNVVLALGGGAIINDELASYLRERSVVVNLSRPISDIIKNIGNCSNRPLARDGNKLKELYNQRKNKYEINSHHTVELGYNDILNLEKILLAILYNE